MGDPVWGNIQAGVFQGQDMVVGTTTSICMAQPFVDARLAAIADSDDSSTDNIEDLNSFLDNTPGIREALELPEDGDFFAIMDAWGTDETTNAEFRQTYYCVGGAAKLAALAAGAATAMSALL